MVLQFFGQFLHLLKIIIFFCVPVPVMPVIFIPRNNVDVKMFHLLSGRFAVILHNVDPVSAQPVQLRCRHPFSHQVQFGQHYEGENSFKAAARVAGLSRTYPSNRTSVPGGRGAISARAIVPSTWYSAPFVRSTFE